MTPTRTQQLRAKLEEALDLLPAGTVSGWVSLTDLSQNARVCIGEALALLDADDGAGQEPQATKEIEPAIPGHQHYVVNGRCVHCGMWPDPGGMR